MTRPMPAPPRLRRLHDLDAMRSILMMLGVVLHAANPYRPGGNWLVHDTTTSASLAWTVDVIHLFRMPAFFVVAGFFAMHSLVRRDTTTFLTERLVRLMVPFVAALVTLNLFQTWWLLPSPRTAASFWSDVVTLWWNGRLIGHLWFLFNLSIYCVVAAICAVPLRRFAASPWPGDRSPQSTARSVVAVAIGLGLLVSIMDFLGPAWLHHYILGLFEPVELLEYSVFFVAGLMLYGRTELLSTFAKPGAIDLLAGLGAVGALAIAGTYDNRVASTVTIVAHWTLVWTTVRLCFAAFRRWASHPSPTFVYLSDASYSVYLFHHLIVVMVAQRLVGGPGSAWMKFGVVVTVATVVTLAIHHFLILRSPTLRLLFNGTRKPFRPLVLP